MGSVTGETAATCDKATPGRSQLAPLSNSKRTTSHCLTSSARPPGTRLIAPGACQHSWEGLWTTTICAHAYRSAKANTGVTTADNSSAIYDNHIGYWQFLGVLSSAHQIEWYYCTLHINGAAHQYVVAKQRSTAYQRPHSTVMLGTIINPSCAQLSDDRPAAVGSANSRVDQGWRPLGLHSSTWTITYQQWKPSCALQCMHPAAQAVQRVHVNIQIILH